MRGTTATAVAAGLVATVVAGLVAVVVATVADAAHGAARGSAAVVGDANGVWTWIWLPDLRQPLGLFTRRRVRRPLRTLPFSA
jgi:hypothetical protein